MLMMKMTEMKQSKWVKHMPHGAGPVCWGPSSVDVPGKYTLGSGTNCMLNEVRRQVIECTCVIGLC